LKLFLQNKIYRPWRASPCLPQLSGPSWHDFTPRLQRLLIEFTMIQPYTPTLPPSARRMRRVHTAHTMFHLMFHTKNVSELVSPSFWRPRRPRPQRLKDLVF
jgi:hypothetical protein